MFNADLSPKRYWTEGTEIPGGGGRRRLYLALHCHYLNVSCVKMGSDVSNFNVSLMVRDKVTRVSAVYNYNNASSRSCLKIVEERGEPKRDRTEGLLLTILTLYR